MAIVEDAYHASYTYFKASLCSMNRELLPGEKIWQRRKPALHSVALPVMPKVTLRETRSKAPDPNIGALCTENHRLFGGPVSFIKRVPSTYVLQ